MKRNKQCVEGKAWPTCFSCRLQSSPADSYNSESTFCDGFRPLIRFFYYQSFINCQTMGQIRKTHSREGSYKVLLTMARQFWKIAPHVATHQAPTMVECRLFGSPRRDSYLSSALSETASTFMAQSCDESVLRPLEKTRDDLRRQKEKE